MEKSPSLKANSFSVNEGISCTLWNPVVRCRFHKSPTPLRQKNPVHPLQFNFFKCRFNVILLSTSRS